MLKAITHVAYKCGDLLASPWTILMFAAISLTALPQTLEAAVGHSDVTVIVSWFSQNFVQLVALSILAFIADRQGHAAQRRADDMYDWLSELHSALHHAHQKLDALIEGDDSEAGK